jgi:hypothetical protein
MMRTSSPFAHLDEPVAHRDDRPAVRQHWRRPVVRGCILTRPSNLNNAGLVRFTCLLLGEIRCPLQEFGVAHLGVNVKSIQTRIHLSVLDAAIGIEFTRHLQIPKIGSAVGARW